MQLKDFELLRIGFSPEQIRAFVSFGPLALAPSGISSINHN
ncbi:hypothetical protein PSM_A0680 [Pseudoalteromonas sp. SM9913]|nr:hypothetical protein PSM_A0680 [Pseudoalteromonas sp. SM9913]